MVQHRKRMERDPMRAVPFVWIVGGLCWSVSSLAATTTALAPATMARIGSIDPRFQSYNVEMVEVTGGRFWRPYKAIRNNPPSASDGAPHGADPSLYADRKPIDLTNPRLRKLAAALGPAYVRVSGTWANTTYFSNAEGPAPATPPKGFNSVLTREQWKGVIDFAHAANAEIISSFAASDGVRNAEGVW